MQPPAEAIPEEEVALGRTRSASILEEETLINDTTGRVNLPEALRDLEDDIRPAVIGLRIEDLDGSVGLQIDPLSTAGLPIDA
jgi:hypothetical protein